LPGTERLSAAGKSAWDRHERTLVRCRRCPRLVQHRREVARVKRRAFRAERYWGRPVPGFGDRRARILVIGLAPGAHGANRTGRMFTGDGSGEWLYRALYRAGLANQPIATAADDGLVLRDVFVTNACRCVPPQNRPSSVELRNCEPFLDRELRLLDRLRVAVALGQIGWNAAVHRATRVDPGAVPTPRPRFGHGAETRLGLLADRGPIALLGSYHPSRQNTNTGRLTAPMLDRIFRRAVALAG